MELKMEGFECKKCGHENVEYVWTNFGKLGKGITHIICLNKNCENYMKKVPIFKKEDLAV